MRASYITRRVYTVVYDVFHQVRDRREIRVSSAVLPTIEGLAGLPLFAGCSRRELTRIARLGTPLTLAGGAVLARQGAQAREFILLTNGRANRCIDGGVVDQIGPGDHIGGRSILSHVPAVASVVADGEVEVRVFETRELFGLIDIASPIASRLLAQAESDRPLVDDLALTA